MKYCAIALILFVALSESIPLNIANEQIFEDENLDEPNILGGKNVSISHYNYMTSVSILYETTWIPFGSAVVVNNKWLLTTALNVMLEDYSGIKVRVASNFSSHGGSFLEIDKYFVIHKHGQGDASENVALIKLRRPLKYTRNFGPAQFGSKLPRNGEKATALGFGVENRQVQIGRLGKAAVPFIDFESCKPYFTDLTKFNYCTNSSNIGPCFFDWGGPLLYKDKVIGIYSYSDDCGSATKPAMYIDLTKPKYTKWIAETIKK